MLNILTKRFDANNDKIRDAASFAVRYFMNNWKEITKIRHPVRNTCLLERTWSLIHTYLRLMMYIKDK
jgi:hypothetical protein